MIKVGIVGGTGYTGAELVRILSAHPRVEITCITSREAQGQAVASHYSSLRGVTDLCFSAPSVDELANLDVVFFATPHGVAQSLCAPLLEKGVRIIDLSADFRIRDVALWEQWYGVEHQAKDWLKSAVYGLPEFNRDKIQSAQLVAAPGCYPTSVQLALMPIMGHPDIDHSSIIINSASGVTGAGRSAKQPNLFCEVNEDYRGYGVEGHRHLPEIEQGLSDMAGKPVEATFVPHLLPISRGILSTIYVRVSNDLCLRKLYKPAYQAEPFVDLMGRNETASIGSVRLTNRCQISLARPVERDLWVVHSAIDNLTKGASGQAVQIMNIMLGIDEQTGLTLLPCVP